MSAADVQERSPEETNVKMRFPEATNVKLLWHNGFWDGPLDGVCEYEGRRHAFGIVQSSMHARDRIYVVTELSPEQLAALEEQHARFQQYVGTHTDYHYDAEGRCSRNHGALKPQSEWTKFYNQPAPAVKKNKKSQPSPSQPPSNRIVAWFRRQ